MVDVAPICHSCRAPARLTNGREIYPHRHDLHEKPIWRCDGCSGYVGCHPGTTRPLGTPANAELRRARMLLHERVIDPLWMTADRCGLYEPENDRARSIIRKAARVRVYSYLADQLGLSRDQTHTGLFDLEMCRRAQAALRDVTYPDIRTWSKQRRQAA